MGGERLVLRFPSNQIIHWASCYDDTDDVVREMGDGIRNGQYLRKHLVGIALWKSARRVALIRGNSDSEIAEALRVAATVGERRIALGALMSLEGVHLPTASAVLAWIHPDRYTIIDWRALEALGQDNSAVKLTYYLDNYLPFCLDLARDAGVSLRVLDRALWGWSKHRANPTKQPQ